MSKELFTVQDTLIGIPDDILFADGATKENAEEENEDEE